MLLFVLQKMTMVNMMLTVAGCLAWTVSAYLTYTGTGKEKLLLFNLPLTTLNMLSTIFVLMFDKLFASCSSCHSSSARIATFNPENPKDRIYLNTEQ